MSDSSSDYGFDIDKAAEMTLALLALTVHDQVDGPDGPVANAWKGHDWDVMNYLHEQGYIGNPRSKAKSVVLSPEGLERARELFEKHFGRRSATK